MKLALFHTDGAWAATLVHALLGDGLDELALFEAADADGPNPDIARHAREVGAPTFRVVDADSDACFEALSAFSPDLLLVATFPSKLPQRLLLIPSIAAVNVHPSLLPRYRGAHPEFWVIRNGENESGVTLHRMSEQLDAGEVICQRRVELAMDETLDSLCDKLGEVATAAVREFLEFCRAGGSIVSTPQDDASTSAAPRVRPADLRIDWTEPAAEVERLVRASYPWLEATATIGGREVVVRRCALASGPSDLAPGEFRVQAATGFIEVGAGHGALVLERVEYPG